MAGFMDKMKAFGQKITGTAPPPEPESLPQQLLRQVDEATTLTWKQVGAVQASMLCVQASLLRWAVSKPGGGAATANRCSCRATALLQRAVGFSITFGVGLLLSFLVRAGGGADIPQQPSGRPGLSAARAEAAHVVCSGAARRRCLLRSRSCFCGRSK